MKTIIAALAGASLLGTALPALAQHHGGGGGGWSHGGASPGAGTSPSAGGWSHGGSAGGSWAGHGALSGAGGAARGAVSPGMISSRGFAGARTFNGDHFHHHYRTFPVFVGGFGFAAFDPWFFDGPFYGYWEPYPYYAYGYAPYGPPPSYYTPPAPRGDAAAPPPAAQQPPVACGSWVWDSAKQAYNWVPCGT